jgi:hypothetical protein
MLIRRTIVRLEPRCAARSKPVFGGPVISVSRQWA